MSTTLIRAAALAPLLLAAPLAWGQAAKAPPPAADPAEVERQLEAAQERLEKAAREVAELSGRLSGDAVQRVIRVHGDGPRRAMLGINLGSGEDGGGVRVVGVSPGGPAAEAGVKAGDVIVAFDGRKLASGRELVREMREVKAGDKVALELAREGKPIKVVVVARAMPEPRVMMFEGGDFGRIPMPPLPPGVDGEGGFHWLLGGFGDAEFATLSPRLGRYFGTDKGVLVVRAPADDGLKLEDGDVILAIDGREPQNGGHALRILRSYQPGETIRLTVLRDRKRVNLEGKAPEASRQIERRMRRIEMTPPAPPAPPAPPGGSAA